VFFLLSEWCERHPRAKPFFRWMYNFFGPVNLQNSVNAIGEKSMHYKHVRLCLALWNLYASVARHNATYCFELLNCRRFVVSEFSFVSKFSSVCTVSSTYCSFYYQKRTYFAQDIRCNNRLRAPQYVSLQQASLEILWVEQFPDYKILVIIWLHLDRTLT